MRNAMQRVALLWCTVTTATSYRRYNTRVSVRPSPTTPGRARVDAMHPARDPWTSVQRMWTLLNICPIIQAAHVTKAGHSSPGFMNIAIWCLRLAPQSTVVENSMPSSVTLDATSTTSSKRSKPSS